MVHQRERQHEDLHSKSMEQFHLGRHPAVINSILVGGVYENKGQCKRPTAVLWVDMWMSQRALFGTNELIFFFFQS